VSPPLRLASPVVEGGVSGEMGQPVPPSPRTLYETEKEIVRAQFEVEAQYESWSLEPGSAPATKARTALAIHIRHGLFSETVEMGSLDDFKGVAEEFLSSASRRMKLAEALMEFSMMEVSWEGANGEFHCRLASGTLRSS
jgi:hypothetical protein